MRSLFCRDKFSEKARTLHAVIAWVGIIFVRSARYYFENSAMQQLLFPTRVNLFAE
jgi:hypothetical protein